MFSERVKLLSAASSGAGSVALACADVDLAAFGRRVQAWREELGLTQDGFGFLVGAGRSTVQSWERGDAVPRGDNLAMMWLVLGVSADELLTDLAPVSSREEARRLVAVAQRHAEHRRKPRTRDGGKSQA